MADRTGWELAQAGAQQAIDHADRVDPHWSSRAWALLLEYVRQLQTRDPDKRFMAEDVRAWAEGQGLAKAPDARAWGALLSRARRGGRIVGCGYAESKNRQAHSRPTQVWRVGEP